MISINIPLGVTIDDLMNYGPSWRASHPLQITFEQEALEELNENLTPEEKNEDIFNVYDTFSTPDHTANPSVTLGLNLSSQDYVIPAMVKRMRSCFKTAVFYKKKLLWKTNKFSNGATPEFLDKNFLLKKFRKLYPEITLCLGELNCTPLKSIAWQCKTNHTTFYIPWHNGCFVKETPELKFEEKEFNELKRTYKILRFKELKENEIYQILIG